MPPPHIPLDIVKHIISYDPEITYFLITANVMIRRKHVLDIETYQETARAKKEIMQLWYGIEWRVEDILCIIYEVIKIKHHIVSKLDHINMKMLEHYYAKHYQ